MFGAEIFHGNVSARKSTVWILQAIGIHSCFHTYPLTVALYETFNFQTHP